MTKQEAQCLCRRMTKEGWTEVRVEPSVGEGYVVAYRRTRDEAHRYARQLSPGIQARFAKETRPTLPQEAAL